MNKRHGVLIFVALSLLLFTVTDSASYSTAQVAAQSTLKICSSQDALLGVPAFDPALDALTVRRGDTEVLTFSVIPRLPGELTLSFAELSTPPGLNCLYSADSADLRCILTVSPEQDLPPGNYLVQAVVTGQGDGVSGSVKVSLPVIVAFARPIAIDDEANTAVNTPVTIPVTSNDHGDNDPAMAIQDLSDPVGDGGSAEVSPDRLSITYTPATDWSGVATFSYTLQNSSGSCAATVTVTVGQ